MKAISLHQPWASLVVAGVKRYETRSWPAPKTIIGKRIYIHAAKTRKGMRPECLAGLEGAGLDYTDLPFGAIIGTVTVAYSRPTDFMREDEKDVFGDYSPGRYAWRLEDPMQFNNPWPYRGHQGIFNVDPLAIPWPPKP